MRTLEPEADTDATTLNENDGKRSKGGSRSAAVYKTSDHLLLPKYPNSTASKVVDWQLQHHPGFVPSFISTIRHGPIHNQQHRWSIIRDNIENRVGRLRKVYMVLGETDPIIIADELVEDATNVLGKENVRVEVVRGVGHEVAISSAGEVMRVVERAFKRKESKRTSSKT